MPGHPRVLVGCFGALLWLWFATTDSDWWCRRQLIRLSTILGGAGAGVRISHTTGWTWTTQSERDIRLWASLPLIKCCVFRSPLTVSFSVTAVFAFLAMSCFRLYLGSVFETRVCGSCFYDFLTLHNESCISAILAICICCYWGVRAWNFPATAVYISRGGFLASLLVKGVLRVFPVLLGFSKAISERFLVKRKLRFRLPGGINHLYTWVLWALSRWWMFASGALRGTASTFYAGVLLAGPDPIPQLPVNMGHRWNIRLQKTNIVSQKQFRECLDLCVLHLIYKQDKQQITSVLTELLTGCWSGSSVVLSLSDSDLELLSESLELADSTSLECTASNDL